MTIGKHISIDNTAPTPAEIANAACARWGVLHARIADRSRHYRASLARGQCAALLREWRRMSWLDIAAFMGIRHTTAISSANRFWRDHDKPVRDDKPKKHRNPKTPDPRRFVARGEAQ